MEITSHEVVYAGRPAILALMNNVTERKRAEEALQKREEHYRSLIENASDLILILNAHGTLSYVSPSVERALAYAPDELICRNLFEFLHPQDFSDSFSAISRIIETPGESRVIEFRMRHRQGSWRIYEAICKCVLDEHGDASAIINARDITERKAAEEQLVHNAFHDPLTNLPNRRLFLDRLNQAIIRSRRRSGNMYAVFFLDLDQFKLVNDSLGHNAGDELLVALSRRLQTVLREEDTIARMGGDEFAILVEDVEGPDQDQSGRREDSARADLAFHAGRAVYLHLRQHRHCLGVNGAMIRPKRFSATPILRCIGRRSKGSSVTQSSTRICM